MNQGLIARLTSVRATFADAQGPALQQAIEQLDRDVEQGRKQKESSQEQPSESDMVNALMARISDDLAKSAAVLDTAEMKRDAYVVQLSGHLDKLAGVMRDLERELAEVKREEAKHISPDSIMHTGFDRSFVTPKSSAAAAGPSSTATRTVTTDEVLNPASVGKHRDEDEGDVDDNGDLKLDDDARAFASLTGMSSSMDYIHKHLAVVSDKKADQILGHAFTLELAGSHALSKQYVRQSLILTYILQMGASGVNVFFSRIGAKGQAQDMFEKDVESRYKHIVGRCEVIRSEGPAGDEQQQEVESIQLQCDDPNAPIRMSVPDAEDEDPERVALFAQLPENMQDALRVGTLEAVNKVLADVSGPEAERLLGICGQGNFLVVDGEIVVDPNEEQQAESDDVE
ncbi:hsp90 co-chaperone Cdc37 [Coemansia furcata]|uniref:Hsp90 co-chaperone Cdc37 n=1 Tax=Coemansia furcata TaxID=417177 RepID=A0ACC1KWM7_9FUNG|nr:hsp90 co-chaperone Cdc37 [Coemansia furcata]